MEEAQKKSKEGERESQTDRQTDRQKKKGEGSEESLSKIFFFFLS